MGSNKQNNLCKLSDVTKNSLFFRESITTKFITENNITSGFKLPTAFKVLPIDLSLGIFSSGKYKRAAKKGLEKDEIETTYGNREI